MIKGCFFVYVLFSQSNDKIYIGYTSNLEERIKSHNGLSNKGWTKRFRPWVLLHSEIFETKQEALKREKELKSGMGRKFIRNTLLPEFLKNEALTNL